MGEGLAAYVGFGGPVPLSEIEGNRIVEVMLVGQQAGFQIVKSSGGICSGKLDRSSTPYNGAIARRC